MPGEPRFGHGHGGIFILGLDIGDPVEFTIGKTGFQSDMKFGHGWFSSVVGRVGLGTAFIPTGRE